jgi:hypothetical protein
VFVVVVVTSYPQHAWFPQQVSTIQSSVLIES